MNSQILLNLDGGSGHIVSGLEKVIKIHAIFMQRLRLDAGKIQ